MKERLSPREFYLTLVDDEYIHAIGQVAVQWSLLESQIEDAIWRAADVPIRTGYSITSQTMMLGKLDMLAALLSENHKNLHEPFTKVHKYIIQDLSGQRNHIIHSMWSTDRANNTTYTRKVSARGKLMSETRPVDIEEVREIANDIADVTDWTRRLIRALRKQQKQPSEPTRIPPKLRNRRDSSNRKERALQPLTVPTKGAKK